MNPNEFLKQYKFYEKWDYYWDKANDAYYCENYGLKDGEMFCFQIYFAFVELPYEDSYELSIEIKGLDCVEVLRFFSWDFPMNEQNTECFIQFMRNKFERVT